MRTYILWSGPNFVYKIFPVVQYSHQTSGASLRHQPTMLLPSLPILSSTSPLIPDTPMNK